MLTSHTHSVTEQADELASESATVDPISPHDLSEALKLSVGLCNILVHEYINGDLDILAAAIPQAQQYTEYVRPVAWWLQTRQQPSHVLDFRMANVVTSNRRRVYQ